MIYGAHESIENQQNSIYRWNLDHKKSKSKGGDNSIENLQAVHVKCNRKKGSS
ncbi:HNH endonuclease [Spiroplasma sp. ald]|uniref:HNH endonuclease n=1 Tax=unclassified Spiroplasma TaxID=2637901 RepID=UPI0037DCF7ED